MAYAQFTRTIPNGTIAYVNPKNVAFVDTFGTFTRIHFTAADKEGNLVCIGVTNTLAQVITALEAASQ